jgi:hypothetical protein
MSPIRNSQIVTITPATTVLDANAAELQDRGISVNLPAIVTCAGALN